MSSSKIKFSYIFPNRMSSLRVQMFGGTYKEISYVWYHLYDIHVQLYHCLPIAQEGGTFINVSLPRTVLLSGHSHHSRSPNVLSSF